MAAKTYSAEFKDALVQEVIPDSKSIAKVARENGVVEQKLRSWVTAYRKKNSYLSRSGIEYPTLEHARIDITRYIE